MGYFSHSFLPLVLYTVRYFQPNRSGLLLCNTVRASNRHRTFTYPYIPYGCLQTTVRDFLCIYRTGFYFRRRFPTSLKTARVCFSHRTGPSLLVVSNDTSDNTTDRDCNKHRTVFTFPAFPSFSWKFLGRISTRNRRDLRVRDTGHSLLFFGLPRTGSFPTSTHTHRTGFPANSLKTVRYFCSCFLHTVRAAKTLKTKILHKEQTSHTLEKNSIHSGPGNVAQICALCDIGASRRTKNPGVSGFVRHHQKPSSHKILGGNYSKPFTILLGFLQYILKF